MQPRDLEMPDILGRDTPPPVPAEPPPPGGSPWRRWYVWLPWVLTIVTLVAAFMLLRRPTEPLTAEKLAAAQSKWSAAGIRDYRFLIELESPGSAWKLSVIVRDGRLWETRSFGADDRLDVAPSDPDAYTMEGLFELLERELEMAGTPAPDGSPPATMLRAAFDAELGFPRDFVRAVRGTNASAGFRVTEFEVLEPLLSPPPTRPG
jgi:hypothetical protein